jgi:predicted anti-sigma-YlaC factor YlaD
MTDPTRTAVRATPRRDERSTEGLAARYLTLATGVIFLVVGIVGFAITGFDDFADHDTGETLLGFELNGLHNVAHLAFGLLGLLLWRTVRAAQIYGLLLVVGYAVVLAFGIAAVGEDWNFLSINTADNWLHLAFVVLGAVIAALAYRDSHPADDFRRDRV